MGGQNDDGSNRKFVWWTFGFLTGWTGTVVATSVYDGSRVLDGMDQRSKGLFGEVSEVIMGVGW